MRSCRYFLLQTIALLACAGRLAAATPIPFQFRDGMIWLKVAVPGKTDPLNFLLDSGAGASVVDLRAARRLGLKLGECQTVQGIQGRGVAYRVQDFTAQVAGVTVPTSLLAVDLSAPSASCHQRIDGLLGLDFFRGRIVEINYFSQTVRLLQESEMNRVGGETLPLTTRNDSLCARVAVNGSAPEWLRLDTGCNSALEWVVTGDKAKNLGATTIGVHSGSVREIQTEVLLGSKHIASVKTGLHAGQIFPGEAGLIGNGLLSRYTVIIDASKHCWMLTSR